ncbi:MAG: OB-fold domain-containing protein [Pseudomonadota bacterium]
MDTKKIAALDGWHTLDQNNPALLGTQCTSCGTYYFPKQTNFCRNPDCNSVDFKEVPLSNKGTVWSYTSASYQPPEPFVPTTDPFEPFTIAAVQLEKEKMVVLGQTIQGVTPEDLKVGDSVELVLDTLHTDTDDDGNAVEKVTWKWKPVTS